MADPSRAQRLDVGRRRAGEAEHADVPPAPPRDLVHRDVDHAQDRAPGGLPERGQPDVGRIAGHDEEVHALAQPGRRVHQLRVDLAGHERPVIGVDAQGHAAVVPDHHRRIAAVPALWDQLLADAVHARLEVDRRLRADPTEHPDAFHGWHGTDSIR